MTGLPASHHFPQDVAQRLLELHTKGGDTVVPTERGEPPFAGLKLTSDLSLELHRRIEGYIELSLTPVPLKNYAERSSAMDQLKIDQQGYVDRSFSDLGPEELALVDQEIARRVLEEKIRLFERIPGVAEIESSGYSTELCQQIMSDYFAVNMLLDALGVFSRTFKDSTPIARQLDENLDHDILGHLSLFLNCIPNGEGFRPKPEYMEHAFGPVKDFILQVLKANYSIATDCYSPKEFSLSKMLAAPVAVNATRFEYSVEEGGELGDLHKEGAILLAVLPTVKAYGDSDALALVIYNLVKNPIKLARSSGQKPTVHISGEASADGSVVSIFIRDNGIGLSYDKLRDVFTEGARKKRENRQVLNFIEECLLDENWREHVPPIALAALVMNRGASGGSGTGIGLGLTKQIVEQGHQGRVRVYDHPEYGAGVQIVLPASAMSGADERRATVDKFLVGQLSRSKPGGLQPTD